MNLVIDFGNTFVKAGVFYRGDLVHFESFRNLSLKKLHGFLRKFDIKSAIISSVVNNSRDIEDFLRRRYHFVKLHPSTSLPFKNFYETPKTLGTDRLAAMAGASFLYPKKNLLVINAGTCITYDVVTADSKYYGGNISPGLDMRLKALNTFTDRLPLVRKQFSNDLYGRSTSSAILTGVLHGAYLEMAGFIAEYKKNYTGLSVILTGGDAPIFETMIKSKIFAVPNLVLYGLNKILSLNEDE